jgi:hypothetical protein
MTVTGWLLVGIALVLIGAVMLGGAIVMWTGSSPRHHADGGDHDADS